MENSKKKTSQVTDEKLEKVVGGKKHRNANEADSIIIDGGEDLVYIGGAVETDVKNGKLECPKCHAKFYAMAYGKEGPHCPKCFAVVPIPKR